MRESQRPRPGFTPGRNKPDLKDRLSVPVRKERLDELLLELILIDTVALADPRRGPIAEGLIERVISPGDYARVLDRYDELSDDDDNEAGLVEFVFGSASVKDSHWKSNMVRWLIYCGRSPSFVKRGSHRSRRAGRGDGGKPGVPGSV
ncbi:MAG: hypothetical protein ACM30E_05710, partial [Nitrososphaerales archaeon]